MGTVLDIRGVYRTFGIETAPVRALRGVDLSVGEGEFVAIVGPSGSGKSTLINVAAGLESVDEGEVHLVGERIDGWGEDALTTIRHQHVGMVFQFFHLLESMTAEENVALAAALTRPRREARRRARNMLDLLGIADKTDVLPAVLSGGQRQRLAIARALANEPTLVLADEPTGALDSEGAYEILQLFRHLQHDGQTIVMVTHDEAVASAATRRVVLRDGRIDAA